MTDRVIAVVPTYKGTAYLVDCIRAVLSQSHAVAAVLVIDNNGRSSDVRDAFAAQGWPVSEPAAGVLPEGLVYVPLQENTGSMGGFNEGLRRAYEAGADWIWMVDHDAAPTPTCLEQLLAHRDRGSVLGPVAVPEPGSDDLSFPVWDAVHQRLLVTMQEARELADGGVISGDVCPNNGSLLIKREVMDTIGNIRAEMFHWGGDVEYTLKAGIHGFNPVTVADAVNLHPFFRTDYGRVPGGGTMEVPHGRLTRYCLYRNDAFIYSRYYGPRRLLRRVLKYTWFYLVSQKADVRGWFWYLRATADGVIPVWGRERLYLNER